MLAFFLFLPRSLHSPLFVMRVCFNVALERPSLPTPLKQSRPLHHITALSRVCSTLKLIFLVHLFLSSVSAPGQGPHSFRSLLGTAWHKAVLLLHH